MGDVGCVGAVGKVLRDVNQNIHVEFDIPHVSAGTEAEHTQENTDTLFSHPSPYYY